MTRREATTPNVQINVEVERDQRDALRESAKENDRSFAAEVRMAIRYYLERGSK